MESQLGRSALVCFSGGQDSTTALSWALAHYKYVETIGFDYGQNHAVELTCRIPIRDGLTTLKPLWKSRLGIDHMVKVDLVGQISGVKIDAPLPSMASDGFAAQSRYIPGRNMILLSMAASVAYRRQITTIVYGTSEAEYSGYPDCRDASMKAINAALNLATGSDFDVQCPLMWLNKASVWSLALELGGEELVSLIATMTHTCYAGIRDVKHDWGFGCGVCPACRLREKGWAEYRLLAENAPSHP